MTPEREKIEWAHHSVTTDDEAEVLVHATHRKFKLTAEATTLLAGLKAAGTVEHLVLGELKRHRLVSFEALHDLMHLLTEQNVVLNASWKALWTAHSVSATAKELNYGGAKVLPQQLHELPFFHGLDQDILKALAAQAESYRCPPDTRLTTQGQRTRDLFVLLTGEAGVYAQIGAHPTRLVAKLKAPSLFGEGGFLLGKPRSADVITTTTSQIIRIRHSPDLDTNIQTSKAQSLQRRFWVLHALSASELFQGVPLEAWDELAVMGSIKPVKMGEILFQQDSIGSSFYILVQGQMSVWQEGKQINSLGQGSCIGEVALLASRGVRTAMVKAEQDSIVQEIGAQQFYPLLARNLPLAKELEHLANSRVTRDQQRRRR